MALVTAPHGSTSRICSWASRPTRSTTTEDEVDRPQPRAGQREGHDDPPFGRQVDEDDRRPIQDDPILREGGYQVVLPSAGGPQETMGLAIVRMCQAGLLQPRERYGVVIRVRERRHLHARGAAPENGVEALLVGTGRAAGRCFRGPDDQYPTLSSTRSELLRGLATGRR